MSEIFALFLNVFAQALNICVIAKKALKYVAIAKLMNFAQFLKIF